MKLRKLSYFLLITVCYLKITNAAPFDELEDCKKYSGYCIEAEISRTELTSSNNDFYRVTGEDDDAELNVMKGFDIATSTKYIQFDIKEQNKDESEFYSGSYGPLCTYLQRDSKDPYPLGPQLVRLLFDDYNTCSSQANEFWVPTVWSGVISMEIKPPCDEFEIIMQIWEEQGAENADLRMTVTVLPDEDSDCRDGDSPVATVVTAHQVTPNYVSNFDNKVRSKEEKDEEVDKCQAAMQAPCYYGKIIVEELNSTDNDYVKIIGEGNDKKIRVLRGLDYNSSPRWVKIDTRSEEDPKLRLYHRENAPVCETVEEYNDKPYEMSVQLIKLLFDQYKDCGSNEAKEYLVTPEFTAAFAYEYGNPAAEFEMILEISESVNSDPLLTLIVKVIDEDEIESDSDEENTLSSTTEPTESTTEADEDSTSENESGIGVSEEDRAKCEGKNCVFGTLTITKLESGDSDMFKVTEQGSEKRLGVLQNFDMQETQKEWHVYLRKSGESGAKRYVGEWGSLCMDLYFYPNKIDLKWQLLFWLFNGYDDCVAETREFTVPMTKTGTFLLDSEPLSCDAFDVLMWIGGNSQTFVQDAEITMYAKMEPDNILSCEGHEITTSSPITAEPTTLPPDEETSTEEPEPIPSEPEPEPNPSDPESEPSSSNPEPEPSPSDPEIEPSSSDPESEPSSSDPEPEPSPSDPEVEPSPSDPEPEAESSPSDPEAEPSSSDPEPEPSPSDPAAEPSSSDPEPEPSPSDPEAEPSSSDPEPEPSPSDPEAEPSSSDPESEPSPSDPEAEPSSSDPEPEPSPSDPEAEPSSSDPESEPSPSDSEAEPSSSDPESEPSPSDPEAESSPSDLEPEPSSSDSEPEPSSSDPEPEPGASDPEPDPNSPEESDNESGSTPITKYIVEQEECNCHYMTWLSNYEASYIPNVTDYHVWLTSNGCLYHSEFLAELAETKTPYGEIVRCKARSRSDQDCDYSTWLKNDTSSDIPHVSEYWDWLASTGCVYEQNYTTALFEEDTGKSVEYVFVNKTKPKDNKDSEPAHCGYFDWLRQYSLTEMPSMDEYYAWLAESNCAYDEKYVAMLAEKNAAKKTENESDNGSMSEGNSEPTTEPMKCDYFTWLRSLGSRVPDHDEYMNWKENNCNEATETSGSTQTSSDSADDGNILTNTAGKVTEIVSNVVGNVTETAKNAGGTVVETAKSTAGTVVGTVSNVVGNATDMAQNAAGTVVGTVFSVVGNATEMAKNTAGSVVGTVSNVVGNATETAQNAAGTVAGTVANVAGKVTGTGSDESESETGSEPETENSDSGDDGNVITRAFGTVTDAASSVVDTVTGTVSSVFGKVTGFFTGNSESDDDS